MGKSDTYLSPYFNPIVQKEQILAKLSRDFAFSHRGYDWSRMMFTLHMKI